ncbi:MAG: RND family transporter [bacterium]|nr:RND family transporter [bacterium]
MKILLKYRIIVLLGLLGLTIFMGVQIFHLSSDAGISALLPEDEPNYQYWKKAEKIFGAVEQIVIGITAKESIYSVEYLRLIHELTTFLENLDDVEEADVLSLSNVDDMQGLEDELFIDPLLDVEELENYDSAALDDLRNAVESNPLFSGKLVSPDGRNSVIVANVPSEVTLDEHRVAQLKEIVTSKVDELRLQYPDAEILLSGMPLMNAYITEYMQRDISRLFPLAMLVVLLLLFFLLRSVFGIIAPILVTLFSVIWTFGLKGMLDSPLTIVETIIPVMLIAIGCADGVHIFSEFQEFREKGYAVRDAVLETMRVLTVPVIMTSVTTAIGFASLITAPGISIRNMGIFLGFGVLVAMLFSLTFIPALISFSRSRRPSDKQSAPQTQAGHSLFERRMEGVGAFILQHRVVLTLFAVATLGISVYGGLNIVVESSEFKYLKPTNGLRVDTEKIGERLGGVVSLDIVFEGREADTMKNPEMLRAMEELQRFCEQQDQISYTLSLADYIKRLNVVLHENDPAYDRLPKEIETLVYTEYEMRDGEEVLVEKRGDVSGFDQVAQFLLLYEMGGGDALDDFVETEYKKARVVARLNDTSTQRLAELMGVLQPYVEQHFSDLDATIHFTNYYSYLPVSNLIIKSQIYSLATVFIAIVVLLSLLFRSLPVGLVTSLPVSIAILFNFAVMWFFDISLNIGTSIVAAVGMGVGIDYAIHYYSRFRLLFQESRNYDAALIRAIAESSRAILSNAVAVGLGFLVLIFSEYYAVVNIGWITALSMLTTALSSLVLLPSMLAIFKPRVAVAKRTRTLEAPQNTSAMES